MLLWHCPSLLVLIVLSTDDRRVLKLLDPTWSMSDKVDQVLYRGRQYCLLVYLFGIAAFIWDCIVKLTGKRAADNKMQHRSRWESTLCVWGRPVRSHGQIGWWNNFSFHLFLLCLDSDFLNTSEQIHQLEQAVNPDDGISVWLRGSKTLQDRNIKICLRSTLNLSLPNIFSSFSHCESDW